MRRHAVNSSEGRSDLSGVDCDKDQGKEPGEENAAFELLGGVMETIEVKARRRCRRNCVDHAADRNSISLHPREDAEARVCGQAGHQKDKRHGGQAQLHEGSPRCRLTLCVPTSGDAL